MRYEFPNPTMESVKQKLNWGAQQEMFSADVNPKECRFILAIIETYEDLYRDVMGKTPVEEKEKKNGIKERKNSV